MPRIGKGKTFAVGFWESQTADNSLAEFPSGTDFSWGSLQFFLDGLDKNNTVDVKIIEDVEGKILKSFTFNSNGKKTLDLSQFSEISSTQDIKIRFELKTFI